MKFQEIYPPRVETLAKLYGTSVDRMLELEGDILAVLDYSVQPTIELSIIGILKTELDLQISMAYTKIEQMVRFGIYTGILRESNIISTIFGIFLTQAKYLSPLVYEKFERICGKYEVSVEKARIDFTTFFNILSSYKSDFKELYDLMSY